MMEISERRGTAVGLIAVILWSSSIALIKSVTEALGAIGGAAMIYSLSGICVCLVKGLPQVKRLPKAYLYGCGLLFILYEIMLALAIGFSQTRQQALELGLINYLWPCLIIVFAIPINKQRVNKLIWPGICLSFGGVYWVLMGDGDKSPQSIIDNIQQNPLAYSLALAAAVTWALYSNLMKRYGNGKSGVSLFLLATAGALWVYYFWQGVPTLAFSTATWIELLFIGISTGIAYSAWDYGIQNGNMTLLATASYFTPVFSSLIAGIWLNVLPTWSFWIGVAMVTFGSLLSWLATRYKAQTKLVN